MQNNGLPIGLRNSTGQDQDVIASGTELLVMTRGQINLITIPHSNQQCRRSEVRGYPQIQDLFMHLLKTYSYSPVSRTGSPQYKIYLFIY